MRKIRVAWARSIGLLAVLAIIGWSTAIGYHAQHLYREAQALAKQTGKVLQTAQAAGIAMNLTAEDVCQLREAVGGVGEEVEALQGVTSWVTGPLARQTVWPWLGAQAVLVHEGLNAARSLSDAAWWVLLEVQSDLETAGQVNTAPGVPVPMRANVLARAVAAVQRNRARIVSASGSLHCMGAAADSLPWAHRWQPALRQISMALDGLMAFAATAAEQPDATLLLLVQNPDELRATGGFISALAVVRLDNFRLGEISYMNCFDVEAYWQAHPPAPPPLREYMAASVLLFRDANWAADYPVSAEVLAALYEMDTREHVDAVVALDTVFLQLLLDALGPVSVPEYGVTLTAENVVATAINFWEQPLGATAIDQRDQDFEDWLVHRKDFGRAVLSTVISRLQSVGDVDLERCLGAVATAVEERHLLAWVPDNQLAQMDLDRMGVSGRVMMTGDASLMIVDSNVGWNKVDRHIERAVDYTLTQVDGGWQAEVCMTYYNRSTARLKQCEHRTHYGDSYEALTQRCYWNYVRLLVPPQSELLRTAGLTEPVDQGAESGQRAYGTLVVVPPGEERTVCLSYFIPTSVEAELGSGQRLSLMVQAQPGVRRSMGVRVWPRELDRPVKLPTGWQLDETGAISWSGAISKDLSAVLQWRVAE